MIIVGAKGFAKEVLEVVSELELLNNLVFFDDVSKKNPVQLYNQFDVLKTKGEVINYFNKYEKGFTLGLGNPTYREKLCTRFQNWGGELKSIISPSSIIGSYDTTIGEGANILPNAVISNGVHIGTAVLIYYGVKITHDCRIGDFVELSPGATILGNAQIGNHTTIGANATILPNVIVGNNVIVGAGAVVTKDVPANSVVAGVPAKQIKKER